jgi:hypothetical protein
MPLLIELDLSSLKHWLLYVQNSFTRVISMISPLSPAALYYNWWGYHASDFKISSASSYAARWRTRSVHCSTSVVYLHSNIASSMTLLMAIIEKISFVLIKVVVVDNFSWGLRGVLNGWSKIDPYFKATLQLLDHLEWNGFSPGGNIWLAWECRFAHQVPRWLEEIRETWVLPS